MQTELASSESVRSCVTVTHSSFYYPLAAILQEVNLQKNETIQKKLLKYEGGPISTWILAKNVKLAQFDITIIDPILYMFSVIYC